MQLHNILTKGGKERFHAHRGEDKVTAGQSPEMQSQAKECWLPAEAGESRDKFSPRASRESVALPTP